MQRHVDIYRHKVIMGIHNKTRSDKEGVKIEGSMDEELLSHGVSSMDMN